MTATAVGSAQQSNDNQSSIRTTAGPRAPTHMHAGEAFICREQRRCVSTTTRQNLSTDPADQAPINQGPPSDGGTHVQRVLGACYPTFLFRPDTREPPKTLPWNRAGRKGLALATYLQTRNNQIHDA